MIKYLPLHEHIDKFNKSMEFTRSLGDSACYVNFTEDYGNNLIPISFGSGPSAFIFKNYVLIFKTIFRNKR